VAVATFSSAFAATAEDAAAEAAAVAADDAADDAPARFSCSAAAAAASRREVCVQGRDMVSTAGAIVHVDDIEEAAGGGYRWRASVKSLGGETRWIAGGAVIG